MQGRKSAIPASRSIVEREVTVTELPVAIYPMPSPSQLDQLLDAVGRTHPSLLSVDGPAFEGSDAERRSQYRKQFAAAFEAIGCMRRLEWPSTKVYLSYHIQIAEKLLKSLGRSSMTIRGNAFCAAVLAHFDVPISGINRQHEGITIEVGLDEYAGRPATDAWRQILAGQPPREVPVSRPARVHYGF